MFRNLRSAKINSLEFFQNRSFQNNISKYFVYRKSAEVSSRDYERQKVLAPYFFSNGLNQGTTSNQKIASNKTVHMGPNFMA